MGTPGSLHRALLAAILAAAAGDRLIEGELVRVDVGKRTLVVRPSVGAPREVDVTVPAAAPITAAGRPVAFEELKTGERIAVACEGAASGPCRAKRVRAGPARQAVPPAAAK